MLGFLRLGPLALNGGLLERIGASSETTDKRDAVGEAVNSERLE